jgi:V8-like Glu-specific endopeptidase
MAAGDQTIGVCTGRAVSAGGNMIGRKTGLAIFVLLLFAGSLFAVHAIWSTDTAVPYDGAGAVGALVILDHNKITRPPFCTAAVVSSPAGNLLLTAAHCLGRVPVSVMAFVPDYQGGNGHFRYGLWRVVRQTFPAHWFPDGNIRRDFAFLTVRGDVQAKAGAETLGTSSPPPASVQVIGYTLDGHPVTCTESPTTIVAAGQRQLKFTCKGYVSTASGAPFLVNVSAKTGNGTVVGVVGGYQQGGDSPSISYSTEFGATIKAVYNALTRKG